MPSKSSKLVDEKAKELSSAYNLEMLSKCSVISFTYTKNNSGPRTEPCGTPADIILVSEVERRIDTDCFLLVKCLQSNLRCSHLSRFVLV